MSTDEEGEQETEDLACLLDELHAAIARYVVLPSPEALDAVTLWTAATHAQQAWAHAPRLVIRAPERRCGKSRLLDLVEACCSDPVLTVNASTAAVYRAVGAGIEPPTLLVDEADTIFGSRKVAEQNEELRGLLNAGHQRNRPALRYDAATRRVERIPTFAMAALAGIGAMPATIEDRAIVVHMRRRAPGEHVDAYRHRRDEIPLHTLRDRLSRAIRAHLPELEGAEPVMPVEDRAADTWEPLVALADLAAGDWPDRARHACVKLTAEAEESAQPSSRLRLLADCRTVFGGHDRLKTADLLAGLKALDDAPWAGYGPDGLTAKRLGDMLADFGVRPIRAERSGQVVNVRWGDGSQGKGYAAGDFTDAWSRYCPAGEGDPSHPSQPSPDGEPPWSQGGFGWDGSQEWDGSTRPTDPGTDGTAGNRPTLQTEQRRDAGTDLSVPAPQPVPTGNLR